MRSPAAAFALLALLLAAPAASAHAELVESSPDQGARLETSPAEVWVVLSEPVDAGLASLVVVDAAGTEVPVGEFRFEGGATPRLSRPVPQPLPPGAYELIWKATAKDTHTTGSRVGFAVGGFEPPVGSSVSLDRLDWESAAARALLYAGLSLGLGGSVFLARASLADADRRRLLWDTLAAGSALHFAGILLLIADTVADTGAGLRATLGSDLGQVLGLRAFLGGAAFLLAFFWRAARPSIRAGPWVVAALLFGAALGSALLSHGSIHGPAVVVMDLLHLLSAAAWLGGLALFAFILLRSGAPLDPAAVRATGRRFSTVALVAILVLATTGLVVSLAVLGPLGDLDPGRVAASAYGRFLLGKVALALAMVALGAVNRYVFLEEPAERGLARFVQRATERFAGGALRTGGRRDLGRFVAFEAGLGALVLVLAGFLTSISPPATAEAPDVLEVAGDGAVFHAVLTLDPVPAAGASSTLRLVVTDADGAPVADNTCGRDSCLVLRIAEPGAEGATFLPRPDGEGGWTVAEPVLWVRSGPREATLEVQTAEVYLDTVAFSFGVA